MFTLWKKPSVRFRFALLAMVAVILAAWFLRPHELWDSPGTKRTGASLTPPAAPRPLPPGPAADRRKPVPAAALTVEIPVDAPADVKAFREWIRGYFAAAPAERPVMEARGAELARAHTQAIAALIQSDPRRAIGNAVPMVLRQDLPAVVASLLEDRINVQAALQVIGSTPDPSLKPEAQAAPISRRVMTGDGRQWRAFTYGRRAGQGTRQVASLNGVAVKQDFAVADSPLRVLETGERPDSSGREVVSRCPVSGTVTPIEKTAGGKLPPVTAATPAYETPQRIVYVCSGGHFAAVEEQLVAEEYADHWTAQGVKLNSGAGSGPVTSPFDVPTDWTTGQRKLLYLRVTFPDHRVDPQSEAQCHNTLGQMCDFMVLASYGRCYFTYDVAPLVVLPYPESWYIQRDSDGFAADTLIQSHARTVARTMGYDTAQYDFDVVRWDGVVGSYGGAAYVGFKGLWMKTNSVGTLCHELGHNLGLFHANFWQTAPPSVIGPGENLEYGNTFDVMGSSGSNGHYTASFKNVINWLPQETFWDIRTSGTYRIHQVDAATANPDQRHALRINRDAERNYWCELRQRFTGNTALMNGLMVTWDSWGLGGIGGSGGNPTTGSNNGAHLLDMTPGSFGNGITDTRNDSALYVGRTYSDPGAGIHVTPVARNPGTTPPSMDVVVNLGAFPGNQNPALALGASSLTAGVGTAITLTATASDPDGDPLAYAWRFDDGAYSTDNSPAQVKSWSSAGHYRVQCIASDMKGGRTTRGLTITVGSPTTSIVSGTVTGPGGQPLEGVYVANYVPSNLTSHPNSSTFRGTWTESDGGYALTRLTAGTRTISPTLYPNTFTPSGFTNPLVISGSVAGINFTGAALPMITLTTPDNQAAEGAVPDTGTIRIQRSGSTAAALSVQVFDSSTGTAERITDYTLNPAPTPVSGGYGASVFTIPAGAASLDIIVTPQNDASQEGVEQAVLDFANTTGGYVISGSATAVVSIADDDSSLPVVRLSAVDAVAGEAGADPATLRLDRSGSTAANLVVNLTFTGSAAFGVDYSASAGVTIPSGSAGTTFTITPVDDPEQEGTEFITATLATSGAYLRDSLADSETLVLMDNDLPTVSIVATDPNASEAGPDPGVFTITRTGGDITQPLTVDYALAGRAVHGADYLRLDGRAVIPAGATTSSIVIQPVDDAVSEGAQDVICQLRSSIAYVIGAAAQATVDIADDEGSQVYLKLITSAGVEPASSGTTTPIQFQVIRPVAGPAITVNYLVSGTAIPGTDYTSLPGTVAFAATDTSKTISVLALPDALMENAESVTLTLQPGTGYSLLPGLDPVATGFIVDQDQPTVDVSVADTGSTLTTAGSETSGNLRFIISRRVAIASPLTVQYTMAGTATQGVDYASTTGSATILADATSVYVPIAPVNDTTAEGVESIIMNLTASPGFYGQGTPSATMLLGDNDSYAGGTVAFADAASTVDESVGTWQVPVNFTGSAGSATVRYRVSGGTATGSGKDYTLAEGTLSFSPGQTSRNITLTIHQDSVPEPVETVILQLFNVIGANLGGSSHTVTLNNLSLPETWTDPASFVLLTSATLNGHVIPDGLATMAWFEYGGSTAYGATTAAQPVGSGSTPVNVSAGVSGLSLTGYHFRCVSQNSAGTTYGADQFFGIDATPAVTTLAASVSGTGATLNGTVNANGDSTAVSFEYGLSTAYGTTVAAAPATVNGTADTTVSAVISGLSPGTLYHYRVRGVNLAGPKTGADSTFTTANSVPVASFTSAPTTATARNPVTYSASATDGDGDPLTYAWNFGASYPVQYGASITQTFLFGGTVNLTLTVSDGHGGVATLTRVITVNDPGLTWTQMASGITTDINAVATNGSILAAVGNRGRILTSPDGVTWTPQIISETATYLDFQGITWDGSRFVVVGYDYDFDLGAWVGVVYTSFANVVWVRGFTTFPAPGSLYAVASGGGVTVATGDNATLMRTTNGTNWTKVILPGVAGTDTIGGAAYGGGVFAITSFYGDSVKVMSSPNGTTWTDRTAGSGVESWQDLGKIAWLNNRFVGAGWYSRIRTSTDGAQNFTTTRTVDEETPALAYGDGIYFAAGVDRSAGNADVDVVSIDGQTWQSLPAPTSVNRNAATFFKHRFYTVGNSGQIWRSGDLSAPPSILTQPQGVVALKGDTVQFSVFATGSNPLTYRWRKNGVNITGATAASYAIASAQETDEASYDCVVANGIGSVTSSAAALVVNSPVQIVTQPVGGNILVGQAKIFTIVVTGDQPVLYQWHKDGVKLEGKTGATLPLTDIQVEDAGTYDCVVTNDFGTATSNPALLNVLDKFLALGAATFTVNEDVAGGMLQIPILRTGAPEGTVTATLTVTNGTASSGSDFTPSSLPVSVGPSAGGVDAVINILNPVSTIEANETFTVTLGNPSIGTGLISPSSATVVIVDTSALSPTQDTTAPPAPGITAPAAAAFVGLNTAGMLHLTGTATDNKGVQKVQVSLNGGAFTDASMATPGAPGTSFTFPFVPPTGSNTVQVKSIDYASRVSPVTTRTFTVTRPLLVNVDTTRGSLTPGFTGSTFREVGGSLTIAATPKPPTTSPVFEGTLFTGWTLLGEDVANGNAAFTPQRLGLPSSALEKPTLAFLFREGLELTANFILNPFNAGLVGTYNGLIRSSDTLPDRPPPAVDGTLPGNSTEGFFTATVVNTGAFSGKLTIDGSAVNMAGSFDERGRARFGTSRALTLTVTRTGKPSLIVKLDLGGPPGSVAPAGKITGQVTATEFLRNTVVAVSNVDAGRAFYTGLTGPLTVPDAYLTVTGTAPSPTGRTDGVFTVVLPPVDIGSQPARIISASYTTTDYPQGTGVGTLKVTKAGAVSLTGTLADGTAVTASGALTQDLNVALFAQLYSLKGFLSAQVKLDSTQAESDLKSAAGTEVRWGRPFNSASHYYPHGWAEVIKVDLLGAKYPAAATGQSVIKAANGANLQTADADGNVTLTFSDGQLTEALNKFANLSPADVVTKVPANDTTFTLIVNRATGALTGTLTHTDDTVPAFNAIIFQKGPNAGGYGYFLTKQPVPIDYTGESGGVILIGSP